MKRIIIAVLIAMVSTMCGIAFADTLTLPEDLKVIEAEAFYGDKSLDKVVLRENVTEIGALAFAESGLKEIVLPGSITGIGDRAFADCSDDLVIYVEAGSYAEQWVRENGYNYETVIVENTDFENAFLDDSRHENALLRRHSIDLSGMIYDMDIDADEMTGALERLGFGNCEAHYDVNDRYIFDKEHKIGFIFACDDILEKDGSPCRVFAIICRGTNDNSEWASDFTIGSGTRYHGFDVAAQAVYEGFKQYLSDHSDCTAFKVWVTGHSRGAAVANLLAGYYLPKMDISDSQIYGYTYACPLVDRNANADSGIFNYNLGGDIISRAPFSQRNYRRYGKTFALNNGDEVAGIKVVKTETTDTVAVYLDSLSIEAIDHIAERLRQEFSKPEVEINAKVAYEILMDLYKDPGSDGENTAFFLANAPEFLRIVNEYMDYMVNTHHPDTYLAWIKSLGEQ